MPTRPGNNERLRRRGVALAAAVVTSAGVAGAVVAGAAPAGASTGNHANLVYAWFDKSTHTVHLRGYARHGSSSKSVSVRIYVNGHARHTSWAYHPSAAYDHRNHLHGNHQFVSAFHAPADAKTITLAIGGHRAGSGAKLARYANEGARIVAIAKPYVGSRYSYGASGPHAFDCSGYARYVFRKADVANLPHNAEAQRHRVRHISRKSAKPGDLVFYMSGGSAYHVSIYAGHGMQYSATDPQQGVTHSKIYSSNVVFGTDWH